MALAKAQRRGGEWEFFDRMNRIFRIWQGDSFRAEKLEAMTRHICFLALAAATFIWNAPSLKQRVQTARWEATQWEDRGYRGNGTYSDSVRALIEEYALPSDDVYLVTHNPDGRLLSIERSIQITAAWAHSPGRVRYGGVEGIGDADAVVTSCESGADSIASKIPPHYAPIATAGGAAFRRKMFFSLEEAEAMERKPEPTRFRGVRELAGVGLVALLAGFCAWAAGWAGMLGCLLLFSFGMAIPPLAGFTPAPWFVLALAGACAAVAVLMRKRGFGDGDAGGTPLNRWLAAGAGVAFFAFLAAFALTHTFTAPCGLGVFGGKARLLFLAGGVPEGFFTAQGWDTLQPAYPPGWALITLGCYGVAGFCGEYWTQLLGCAAMAAVLFFLCRRAGGVPAMCWVAASFCTANIIWMGTHYYAEPLMALFVLAGWERVRRGGDDLFGWVLIGAAGWIKNEGILFLPALWLSVRMLNGRGAASLPKLLAGLALPAAWRVGCQAAGGAIPDYALAHEASLRQAWSSLAYVFTQGFRKPWQYGFVFPLAALALILPWTRRTGTLPAVCLAVLMVFCAFAGIFSISRAMDFSWHLASLDRLLWVPAFLLIRECANLLCTSSPRVNSR